MSGRKQKRKRKKRTFTYYFGTVCPICGSNLKGMTVSVRTWKRKV